MLPRNGTGAVIISPTRELAMQIFGVLREIMEEYPGQTCGLVSAHRFFYLRTGLFVMISISPNGAFCILDRLWEVQIVLQRLKS